METDFENFVIDVKGVSFTMVAVKGGTFLMGSNDADAYEWEGPVHSVTLSDYYIGQTEVTQALWKVVMGNNPSCFKGDNLPVDSVGWEDCRKFICKLNELTGKSFCIPTEAQWEFAARGGNKSRGCKYSGSDNIGDVAWYYDNSGKKTHPVASKQANELGIYDMSGNVLELCSDWCGDYSSAPQSNPVGPDCGLNRVYRGGCWCSDAKDSRVSSRCSGAPIGGSDCIGLRLALVP